MAKTAASGIVRSARSRSSGLGESSFMKRVPSRLTQISPLKLGTMPLMRLIISVRRDPGGFSTPAK